MTNFLQGRTKFFFIFLLLFFHLSYPFNIFISKPVQKPIEYEDTLIIPTIDGRILAIDIYTGSEIWTYSLGERIDYIINLDRDVLFVPLKKNLILLDAKKGTEIKKLNFSENVVFGAGSYSSNMLFVLTEKTLIFSDRNGKPIETIEVKEPYPYIGFYKNNILIIDDRDLLVLNGNDIKIKNANVRVDKLFNSRPLVLSDGKIVFGNTAGYFSEVSFSGDTVWKLDVSSWITTEIIPSDYGYIFGTGSGYVYHVSDYGELIWKAKLDPVVDISVKDELIAVASRERIHILDKDGKKKGSIQFKGDVIYVLFSVYSDKIIGVTRNPEGTYQLSITPISPICSITSPKKYEYFGTGEYHIVGDYYSDSELKEISVRVNDKYFNAVIENDRWYSLVDFSQLKINGINEAYCKIVDSNGRTYSSDNAPIPFYVQGNGERDRMMRVVIPEDLISNTEVTINVLDENNLPLTNYNVTVDGNTYFLKANESFNIGAGGKKMITIEKPGYKTINRTVEVIGGEPSYLILVGAFASIVGLYLIIKG